jgi:hypothetical protein
VQVATGSDNVLWMGPTRLLSAATLDHVTIASHCLSLIREQGPLSADELGAACLADGVTVSGCIMMQAREVMMHRCGQQ